MLSKYNWSRAGQIKSCTQNHTWSLVLKVPSWSFLLSAGVAEIAILINQKFTTIHNRLRRRLKFRSQKRASFLPKKTRIVISKTRDLDEHFTKEIASAVKRSLGDNWAGAKTVAGWTSAPMSKDGEESALGHVRSERGAPGCPATSTKNYTTKMGDRAKQQQGTELCPNLGDGCF